MKFKDASVFVRRRIFDTVVVFFFFTFIQPGNKHKEKGSEETGREVGGKRVEEAVGG